MMTIREDARPRSGPGACRGVRLALALTLAPALATSASPLFAQVQTDTANRVVTAAASPSPEAEAPVEAERGPLITNDAVVLGILLAILAFVFATASSDSSLWRRFYSVVPSLLLCYFLPSLLSTFGVISGSESKLYHVASRYLLPTSLVFLTLSTDIRAVLRLGPKAIALFLTGTIGVVVGGPLAIGLFAWLNPEVVSGDVWRGMTTVAGSWIGGGANQAAMKEVFEVGDDLFSALIAVDVIVANVWMAVLLIIAAKARSIDRWLGADTSAIEALKKKVGDYQASVAKIPTTADTMVLLAVGFGVTAGSHFGADTIAPFVEANAPGLADFGLTGKFFWLVVLATTGGLALSFTPVRRLEGVGSSRLGTVCLYVLVATIGMKMDILAIMKHPWLFAVGGVWMLCHAVLMLVVARVLRAPMFFMAVGSQANIGGAASAPIVAAAFHPALAPVGVLLAVVGYTLGTYAAWLCGIFMRGVAPGGG